jgi:hypothetical protein
MEGMCRNIPVCHADVGLLILILNIHGQIDFNMQATEDCVDNHNSVELEDKASSKQRGRVASL